MENLEEMVPDSVFGYGSVHFAACLMMVERSPPPQYSMRMERIPAFNVSIVISYNVVVMKVVENQLRMFLCGYGEPAVMLLKLRTHTWVKSRHATDYSSCI